MTVDLTISFNDVSLTGMKEAFEELGAKWKTASINMGEASSIPVLFEDWEEESVLETEI